jgi:hypothetical protein
VRGPLRRPQRLAGRRTGSRHFASLYDADPIGTAKLLNGIPANTVPLKAIGKSGNDEVERDLLREVFRD